jgi:hypothetical protein
MDRVAGVLSHKKTQGIRCYAAQQRAHRMLSSSRSLMNRVSVTILPPAGLGRTA